MLSLLVLAPLWSPPAVAGDVLWFNGNGGYTSATVKELDAAVKSVGSTGVDSTSTWPSTITDYSLIFLVAPSSAFSSSQVADLQTFIASGGLLVTLGDNSGVSATIASTLNSLLGDLGYSSTYTSSSLDSGCSHYASVLAAHPLTAGISSTGPAYAATNELTVAGGGTELLGGDSGQVVLAVEDRVALATDLNLFDDACTDNADNTTLMQNLYMGVCLGTEDDDADGYILDACGGDDCDDDNPNSFPGAPEICDASDNDCDGVLPSDEVDADGDGLIACEDCDDSDPDVTDYDVWYLDEDGDGFGTAADVAYACEQPAGYADNKSDCDDTDADRHVGATEVCDGDDEDCDGQIDEDDAADAATWYEDGDADGYGDATVTLTACDQPEDFVANGDDCDDSNPAFAPDAPEVCDGLDQDCDGEVDNDPLDGEIWFPDSDGDGYGDAAGAGTFCEQPSGYVDNGEDCDDTDGALYPNASGLDADCQALVEDTGEPKPTGCGCANGGSGGAGWFGLLLGLGAVARRRA